MSTDIPDIVIGRLPIYLRALNQLARQGQEITSSRELGQLLGISSAQIRKDLSHFGGFGKQGTGYHVEILRKKLEQILNVDTEWSIVVVGAGHIGHALAHYGGFVNRGFRVVAVFDNDLDKIGKKIDGFKIQPMEDIDDFIDKHHIKLAMVAVPAEYAQDVANKLIEHGVRGILNYAPITINVPDGIYVQYIDPVAELQHMTFYLSS
ncbi:MAG: redox-sensing transcriptional repressor Rex [Chloroflexi bacterium]|nr:redox-sensing transcriptional repressor Rex [Chloroflexota bacterium]